MIKEINNAEQWNRHVISLPDSTFLQSWQWGQVQQRTGEQVKYLGHFRNEKLLAVALVILVNAKRGKHYLIPHGPLASTPQLVRHSISEFVAYLKQTAPQSKACAIRLAPLLLNTPDNLSFLKDGGFRPAPIHVHAELTWVLDIKQTDQELLSNMRKTTRHAIHKASASGVIIEQVTTTEALDRFWPLYKQTQSRHGFVPWSYDLLQAQLDQFATTDSIFTLIARHNNKDVAAAILIQFGTTVFYYHGASLRLPSSIPAAQLLQWQAIQEARQRGATRYNFWGIAPDNKPQHPFAGITTFKKGFGGRAIDYIHAHDYSLSPKYWKLWSVDTYRKIRRGF